MFQRKNMKLIFKVSQKVDKMTQYLIYIAVIIPGIFVGCEKQPVAPIEQKAINMTKDSNNKDKTQKTDEQWKAELSPEEYEVLRKKGTEAPYTGKYDKFYEDGVYYCAGCGAKLFVSDAKFNSGCGWPAFDKPVDQANVTETLDTSLNRVRTEITCSKCGGHLGHVFEDGPKETTGLRYCINSAALDFEEEKNKEDK